MPKPRINPGRYAKNVVGLIVGPFCWWRCTRCKKPFGASPHYAYPFSQRLRLQRGPVCGVCIFYVTLVWESLELVERPRRVG